MIPFRIGQWRQVHRRECIGVCARVGVPKAQFVVVGEGKENTFVIESHALDLVVVEAMLLDYERFFVDIVGVDKRNALVGRG